MEKYRLINDPGHAWLEVPLSEIRRLGIWDKISTYSYMYEGHGYLEEDCDMGVFMNEKRRLGETVEFTEVFQKNTGIRNYQMFC